MNSIRVPLRRAYRLLHPKLVTVIGASAHGETNFMPASWVMPASFDPPLLVAAVGEERYTLGLILDSGEMTVNPVGPNLIPLVEELGSLSGREADKASLAGTLAAEKVSAPCLPGALACIEARLRSTHPAGDHVLVVAEVVAARAWRCFDAETHAYREGCGPVYHVGGHTYMEPGRYVEWGHR